MVWIRNKWHLLVTHLGAMLPLAVLLFDWYMGDLTANPIRAATLRTGKSALVLLMLLLACTPLNTFLGLSWVLPLRKWLGIYASFYAGIHFAIFAGLDYGFDLVLLRDAIFKKRYAIAGFASGIILLALAITSTHGWKERLGNRWKQLHRLVYLAASLAVVHYIWLAKSDLGEPLLYSAIVVLLLILRIPHISRLGRRLRLFLTRKIIYPPRIMFH